MSLAQAKVGAFIATGSKSVLASLADSAVDLASQFVLSGSEYLMARHSDSYPVGRGRLEALGVIGCACIMSIAALEVLQDSVGELWLGCVKGVLPELDAGFAAYGVLVVGTCLKQGLYFYCMRVEPRTDTMSALGMSALGAKPLAPC